MQKKFSCGFLLRRQNLLILLGLAVLVGSGFSLNDDAKPELFKNFMYRNLGPFRAGAWVGDIAVPENPGPEHRYTIYVASRNGGVWKTVNNGTTFFPIFDNYGVNAIGSVEVAPSDPNIVWVGTGEDSYARSSYAGNGIYKSSDAGQTFTKMGLSDSHHIGRIIIHPTDPDTVYAAVMGHLFSENEERGVFKTMDAGRTWKKILYIDEKVGVVDLAMNFSDPNILYAASYDKVRLPWHYEAGGEGSRIHRTKDGGKTWEVLTNGLPGGMIGRIGIDVHRADPRILYAVIDNLNLKPGIKERPKPVFDSFSDNSHEGVIGGEVYRSDDGGDSWRKVSPDDVDVAGKAAYSFNEINIDPADPDKIYIIGVSMQYSLDGGKTWPRGWRDKDRFLTNFGDVRTFWIDPADPEHMMMGSDGGFYITYDGGRNMAHFYQIPLGEIYDVEVDNSRPYNIYAGLQDHEAWKGPVNGWSGSVGPEDWVITGMWDGMYTKVNPENNRWLYFTTQFGKHHRVDQLKGERIEITPQAPEGRPFYRYTWTTPLEISPHNPDIVYTGGQMLLRSLDRGNTWEELSPDLTTNDLEKISGAGHIMFCTITTISESPVTPGIIWVGTDDGRIHMTRNHGAVWTEFTSAVAKLGGPADTWVSRVVASSHDAGTAYVAKSGYRQDDFNPYVFRTRDFGKTWEKISGGLPDAPVSALHEDRINPDLLFIGNDLGVYFSLDGGKTWLPLKNNMPTLPVRDLLVHPREQDLVVGSYGRGVWVTQISPLQELTGGILDKPFHLFRIIDQPVNNMSQRARWGNYHMTGSNHLRTPNEREGLQIFYYIKERLEKPLDVIVEDLEGNQVGKFKSRTTPGIHTTTWNLRERTPGTYRIILTDGETREVQKGSLLPPIHWPIGNPDDFRK